MTKYFISFKANGVYDGFEYNFETNPSEEDLKKLIDLAVVDHLRGIGTIQSFTDFNVHKREVSFT